MGMMAKKANKEKKESKKKVKPLQRNFEELGIFLEHLQNKHGVQPNSIDVYERYGKKMLEWAGDCYFSEIERKSKQSFPVFLNNLRKEDGSEYDQDYINGACSFARRFFEFAYKKFNYYPSRPSEDFFDEFNPMEKLSALETIDYYTEEEMLKIAALEPQSNTELRTIATFLLDYVSGLRVGALLTLPIFAVNLDEGTVIQDPHNGTYTKLGKAGKTVLINNPDLLKPIKQWDTLVRENCPLDTTWYARLNNKQEFDPKKIELTDRNDPETYKQARANYRNFTESVRKICERANVPYRSPHKGRYGNIHKWMENITTMDERKSLADNSLHTLPVLENVYSRMSEGESVSTMQRIAMRNQGNAISDPTNLDTKKSENGNGDMPFDYNSLPEHVKQAMSLIAKDYIPKKSQV